MKRNVLRSKFLTTRPYTNECRNKEFDPARDEKNTQKLRPPANKLFIE